MKPSHQIMARKENIQRLRSKVPLPMPIKPPTNPGSAKKRPQTQKKQREAPPNNEFYLFLCFNYNYFLLTVPIFTYLDTLPSANSHRKTQNL